MKIRLAKAVTPGKAMAIRASGEIRELVGHQVPGVARLRHPRARRGGGGRGRRREARRVGRRRRRRWRNGREGRGLRPGIAVPPSLPGAPGGIGVPPWGRARVPARFVAHRVILSNRRGARWTAPARRRYRQRPQKSTAATLVRAAMCASTPSSSARMVLTETWLAPASRQRSACSATALGTSGVVVHPPLEGDGGGVAPRPRVRPAPRSRAPRRGRCPGGPWETSRRRCGRPGAAPPGANAPSQMGMGRWTGSGASPAAVMW